MRNPMKYEVLRCEKGEPLFQKRFIERKGLPEHFYYRGDISFLNDYRSVAVIGSRNAPKEAILSAYASGQYAAMEGFAVVNGLAVGCDTAALWGALSEGGRCVAVLPCGLDMIVPSVNEYLAEEILEKGGCLISEYEAGTKPEKYRYVQRDAERIERGCSISVYRKGRIANQFRVKPRSGAGICDSFIRFGKQQYSKFDRSNVELGC